MERRRSIAFLSAILLVIISCCPSYAAAVPQEDTPNYNVAFYAFDCYHMQDASGKRYGYGYDMMQNLSKYLQCTFSYIGYDKSAKECEEMLRNGEIDIYTAARLTPERQEKFAFSKHPAITATTCMNVKRGNTTVRAGDYSTYNGLRIGLLQRHTYNNSFIQYTKEAGFDCDIVYYTTPTELSNALINGDVDALVNSYIRTPEDEMTIENFGETPYYFMARKEDQDLIDQIDAAIDEMNIATPNWRSDLYNEYYGSQNSNVELTAEEQRLLRQMQANNTVVKAVMNPDRAPYSWYDDEGGYGIVADIFGATAKELNLSYEIIPVSTKQEYKELLASGNVDICIDMDYSYEEEGDYKYKITEPYIATNVSILRRRGSSGRIGKIGVLDNNIAAKEIVSATWPNAEIIEIETTQQCVSEIVNERVDCVLMLSYMAQQIAREDVQNRLSVDIVPGATLELKMAINSKINHNFFSMWEKTMLMVSQNRSAQIVQSYWENTGTPKLSAYLFDHPMYLAGIAFFLFFMVLVICMYVESTRAKNKQLHIAEQLSKALMEAREANDAKVNFFSKMSHDIRTPLNVVLGMTQIAKKYKHDPVKLDNALENITSEGNYLLTMINSILDINQLDHGHIELIHKPFSPSECMQESVSILRPLAEKKEQKLTVSTNCKDDVVVGDAGRYSQIIVNIVSNAIKYTNVGGEIAVSMEALEDNRYRFICRDNGIGMKPEYIKHICEEYSRAEDSRTSATEGTGLGMAVVKGFTELMKGSLKVESKLNEGSTFIIEIPFTEPTIKEREFVMNAKPEQDQISEELDGKRVLLVEDNALNAEIAMELLQSIGLVVDVAENGKIAVEKFEKSDINSYFAIFMDMQMPVMNGVEATKRIRALRRADSDVLIFAMTANTLTKDRRDCEEAGMNGYISKPINLKDIGSTLKVSMSV